MEENNNILTDDKMKINSINNSIIATELDFTVHIKYIKTKIDAVEPTHGSTEAAGYDLYVPLEEGKITIPPHQTVKIDTGICVALPNGTFGGMFARSGLSTKQGLRPANCVGVIDSDYRGPIIVALHNDMDKEQILQGGDRIAQLIVMSYIPLTFEQTDSLDSTDRGDNGFGSTGV